MQEVRIVLSGHLVLRLSADDTQALIGLASAANKADAVDVGEVTAVVESAPTPVLDLGGKRRNRRAAALHVLRETGGRDWLYTKQVQARANQLLAPGDRWEARSARQSLLKHLHTLVRKGFVEQRSDPAARGAAIPPSQWRLRDE